MPKLEVIWQSFEVIDLIVEVSDEDFEVRNLIVEVPNLKLEVSDEDFGVKDLIVGVVLGGGGAKDAARGSF